MNKFRKYTRHVAAGMIISLSLALPSITFANKIHYSELEERQEKFLFDKQNLISKLEVNKDTIGLPIKDTSITDLNIEFIPANGIRTTEKISFSEFKQDNFYWEGDTGVLYLPNSKDEKDIIVTDQENNLIKIIYTFNGVVYDKIEDRDNAKGKIQEKDTQKTDSQKEDNEKKKDSENIKRVLKQDINFPMSKTVKFNKEIIKVNTEEGALTDLYRNDELIKDKIDSKMAAIGISIPLEEGLNNIKIVSYKNGLEKTFKTVIFFNNPKQSNDQVTNISDLKLTPNGGLKLNGIDIDKDLEELEGMSAEELEERLNKLRGDVEEDSDIIDIDLEMYFIFNKEYSNLSTTEEKIIIYGKAVNAKELYANDHLIDLDENNNFKFIFQLDPGDNLLMLKSVNDGGEYVEKIYIKREDHDEEVSLFGDSIPKSLREEPAPEEEVIVYDNNTDELVEIETTNLRPMFWSLIILSTLIVSGLLVEQLMSQETKDKIKQFFKEKEDNDKQ